MSGAASRVLVCIDFSRLGRGVLEAGVTAARCVEAEVVLLHVLPHHRAAPVYEGPDVQRMFEEAAQHEDQAEVVELSNEWAERARSWGLRVRPMAVPGGGPPSSAILDVVAQERPDLVVVGRHGHSGLRHLVLGSVAMDVVRRSSVPVLVVPGAE